MKIILTGGGTAGHINPAIALFDYIKKRDEKVEALFVGTENGIEKKLVEAEGFSYNFVDITGFSRSVKDISKNIKTLNKAVKSLSQAKTIIDDFKPDIVIGFGGYASFPMVYKAHKMGIKTAVLEVNAYAGLTTKVLSKYVDEIYIVSEQSREYLSSKVQKKTVLTGSPIKEDFIFLDKNKCKQELGFLGKPLVVSFWGSMGALHMNKKMIEFTHLKSDNFYHLHATGKNSYNWFIEEANLKNTKVSEYIYDMPKVMAAADLVICRAGASTMSELLMTKKPSILIPSPYVTDNHQEKNARSFEKTGGAVVLLEKECTGEQILKYTEDLISDEQKLESMQNALEKEAKLDSNEIIYSRIKKLI